MTDSLKTLLQESTVFAGLEDSDLDAIAELCRPVTLAPRTVLFHQRDIGDALYLLASGELIVSVDGRPVDVLGTGAVVGEMALLSAPVRNATVSAGAHACELWRLAREDFDALTAARPAVLERIHDLIRPRLERAQLAPLLAERFGASTEAELKAWQERLTWRRTTRGESVYCIGDAAAEAHLVVAGRFVERDAAGKVLRVAGRGALLGEAAVVGESVRRTEAVAAGEGHLATVPATVAATSPTFLVRLAADVLARHEQGGSAVEGTLGAALLFAPASADATCDRLVSEVAERMAGWGPSLVLSSAEVDRRFARVGAAQTSDDNHATSLELWLDEAVRSHRYVLLVADPTLTPWTRRCLHLADRLVLVAAADGPSQPGALESSLRSHAPDLPSDLVLVHPDSVTRPTGTTAWLQARDVSCHHHVRLGVKSDLDRLSRRLAGRAVGLALSGGGARGFVHVGLLKALEERGIAVDVVYGASMGAVIGGGYALTRSAPEIERICARFADRKQLMDSTLPLVALTRSRRINEILKSAFGTDTLIEDMWIPFLCVSASLTNAELRLHDRGPLWRAIRASAAIPGVFTPLLTEDGSEVLVDGGVMNNMPVELLREHLGSGVIIASNAYGGKSEGKPMRFGDDVSGWAVLRSKLLPVGRRLKAPSLLGTLMRATSLASKSLMDEAGRYADLVVTYPANGVTSLEFDRYAEMITAGHTHGGAALDEWLGSARVPPAWSQSV